jgi:hypothetical protein
MVNKDRRASFEASEQRLWKQLEAASLVDVLGVLSGHGVGGGWSQGDKLWTLSLSFASWRIAGGPLRTQELFVRRKVRERAIDRYRQLVKPDVVTRIRARVVENSVFHRPDALLEKVLGQDKCDAELNAEVHRLQKPVRFKDNTFGTFTLNRRVDWFEGKATWNGRKVQLALSACEPAEVERALKVGRTLWRAQKKWQAKVLAYAVQELLPVKNEHLEEDEQPLSSKQFQARMKLENITVNPDGSFTFWYDDGDLFWGHAIQICGSVAKGLYDADTPG